MVQPVTSDDRPRSPRRTRRRCGRAGRAARVAAGGLRGTPIGLHPHHPRPGEARAVDPRRAHRPRPERRRRGAPRRRPRPPRARQPGGPRSRGRGGARASGGLSAPSSPGSPWSTRRASRKRSGRHVREILFAALDRPGGTAAFEELESDSAGRPEGAPASRLSTGQVLLEAARRLKDPATVREALGDLDRRLVLAADPRLRAHPVALTPTDGFVLSRIDGTLSAREIVDLMPLPPEETERSLLGLLCTGAIAGAPERPAARRAPAPPRRPAPPPRAAPPRRRPPAAPAPPARRRRRPGPGLTDGGRLRPMPFRQPRLRLRRSACKRSGG